MAKTKKPLSPIGSVFGIEPALAKELFATLTEREAEVAELMATGEKNRAIAKNLGISIKTLDVHRTVIRRKLQKARGAVDVARIVYAAKFAAGK